MNIETLTPQQLLPLSAQIPTFSAHRGWSYEKATQQLTITDDALATAIQAVMAVPGWDAVAPTVALPTHTLTPDQASELAAQIPNLGTYPGWSYDSATQQLTIADAALAAAAQAIMAVAGWDAAAGSLQLVTYANAAQWAKATGGCTVTAGGQTVTMPTDDGTRTAIEGKFLRQMQADAPASIVWQFGPRQIVTFTAAEFLAAGIRVADFVQATFNTLGGVLAGIQAGTITTTAQIDAAFAAIA